MGSVRSLKLLSYFVERFHFIWGTSIRVTIIIIIIVIISIPTCRYDAVLIILQERTANLIVLIILNGLIIISSMWQYQRIFIFINISVLIKIPHRLLSNLSLGWFSHHNNGNAFIYVFGNFIEIHIVHHSIVLLLLTIAVVINKKFLWICL